MKITIDKGKYDFFKKLEIEIDAKRSVLLGKEESGKSTFLNLLAGFLGLEKGEVYFDDKEVTNLSPQARKAAYIYQNYNLYPNLSVKENITFGLRIAGEKEEFIEKALQTVVDLVKIEELLDLKVVELTDLQNMKVAMAKALIKDPYVLLIDEAFDNIEGREELFELLKKLEVMVIYATKDEEIAKILEGVIYRIDDGKIEKLS